MALDDLGDRPLIVRSSSLLEDRMGTAFSGKYKSLFLANQGSKQERLEALTDAIAEVYASIFGPDPIEYRAERGLLDFHEEMGIMIQEVVGTAGGQLFLPRLRRRRLQQQRVPLVAAHQARGRPVAPGARAGHARRRPRQRRLPGADLARAAQPARQRHRRGDRCATRPSASTSSISRPAPSRPRRSPPCWPSAAREYPGIEQIVSVYEDDHIYSPSACQPRFRQANLFVTFEGLISRTPFVKQLQTILQTLQEKMDTPVDIEFASDGKNLYLLQCRPQSLHRRQRGQPDPQGHRPRPRHLHRQPLHLQRQGPRHHPHRLRRSRKVQPAGEQRRDAGRSGARWAS